MITRKRRLLAISGAIWLLLGVLFVLWNQFGSIIEETLPDTYDFGRVQQGATLEFSARFLTSAKKHPIDELFEKLQASLPESWRGGFEKLHPKHLRAKAIVQTDVSQIKPSFKLPPFVVLENSRGDQRAAWYGGKDFVVAQFHLDTSRTGEFSGEIVARWQRRKAYLPIKFQVAPLQGAARKKVLVTETPFESDATEQGTNFLAATEVLAKIPAVVDCTTKLPENLASYETIMLASGTLSRVSPEQVEQLRQFVRGGGRLVLAANAFFGGTVASANRIMAGWGLRLHNSDHAGHCVITNIATDVLTRGVSTVPFHRPSLIELQDSSQAKLLVLADHEGGYTAISRPPGGGEIIVLTQSLWWWWLQQDLGQGDSARLMENILVRKN